MSHHETQDSQRRLNEQMGDTFGGKKGSLARSLSVACNLTPFGMHSGEEPSELLEVIRIQQVVQVGLYHDAIECGLRQPCGQCSHWAAIIIAPALHQYKRVERHAQTDASTPQVTEWLRQHALLPERDSGQYSSEAAWRSRLNKRRDASAPQPLFVARLLQQLEAVVRPAQTELEHAASGWCQLCRL